MLVSFLLLYASRHMSSLGAEGMLRGAACLCPRVAVVGKDDLLDKMMPHNVLFGQVVDGDAVYILQHAHRLGKSGSLSVRQVGLRQVAGHDDLGAEPHTRQEHLDLLRRRPGVMFGVGLIGIFLTRFFIEFIKLDQEAFEQGMLLNMGQLLSIPFILVGIYMIYRGMHRSPVDPDTVRVVRQQTVRQQGGSSKPRKHRRMK